MATAHNVREHPTASTDEQQSGVAVKSGQQILGPGDPAASRESPVRRVIALLLIEPRWLDGVTRRLVGISALVGAVINSGNYAMRLQDGDRLGAMIWLLANVLTGLMILFIGAGLLNLRRPRLPRPLALVVAVGVGCLIGQALFVFGTCPIGTNAYFSRSFSTTIYFARQSALPWAFAAAAWYFLHRASERAAALRERELGRQRLETRMVEARLTVMQAQVEPHFLFNTLAHIKGMCQTDPALARRLLDSFCDYLRAALPQMRGNTVTLGSELDFARAYLNIQHIRMGRRLSVEIAVPDALRHVAFPPMMLISLVENAVKHGLSPLAEDGTIRIGAVALDSVLRVTVADTGQGLMKSSGSGIGLANIRNRLASLYGAAAGLSLAPNLPRGFVATIALPVAASPVVGDPRAGLLIRAA